MVMNAIDMNHGEVQLHIVFTVCDGPANDNVSDLLAQCEQELLAIHGRTFPGKKFRVTVRYECTMTSDVRLLAFTGRRVEVWHAELEEVVGYSLQQFYLPL